MVVLGGAPANNSSNDAPFMKRINYGGRSMCRLHRKLIVNSSAAHCVATAHVMRHSRLPDDCNRAATGSDYRAGESSCIDRRIVFSSTRRSVTNLWRMLEINVWYGIPSSWERRFNCSKTASDIRIFTFRVFRIFSSIPSILFRSFFDTDRYDSAVRSISRSYLSNFAFMVPFLHISFGISGSEISSSTQSCFHHLTRMAPHECNHRSESETSSGQRA